MAGPVAPRQRPGDVARGLRVDQLLDDRPRERLERLGLAQHAQLRAGTDDPAEHRVGPVRAVERLKVVVERQHEAQALDRRRLAAQQHLVAAPGGLGELNLAVDPDRPPDHVAPDLEQAAGPR
jgi:hypothetical protein